ncbi:hypothetical protein SDC9_117265 [bioreactor metagenome]|uniref:Polysaccharide chain length determinant N-terminal domain-containing protein n=1 Tax=bioreactor metagenome TaxID=1076179 RepID=A0A645BXU2_9ZZZZ
MVIYSTTTNMQTSVDICNAVLDAAPEVFTSVVKFGYCEPVDNAYMPKYPVQSNPRSLRNTFVSGFMGVAVAIALILLIYMLDNRIKGTSDIKDNYQVAILGEIPNFSLKSDERYSNYGSSKEKGQRRGY